MGDVVHDNDQTTPPEEGAVTDCKHEEFESFVGVHPVRDETDPETPVIRRDVVARIRCASCKKDFYWNGPFDNSDASLTCTIAEIQGVMAETPDRAVVTQRIGVSIERAKRGD